MLRPDTLCALLSLPLLAWAQLSGRVGPTTTRAQKAATKVCNIMDFGAVAWLPESFAAYTLAGDSFKTVCDIDAVGLMGNTNVPTMSEIAWILQMTADPALGASACAYSRSQK